MKYRKKPVVVEAYQTDKEVIIHTLEGDMKANVGDYIITGVNGEQYPCKPDIFEKTYELVKENEPPSADDSLTNKDIIKALELCFAEKGTKQTCGKCPYHKFGELCKVKRDRDALDLINRLQTENKELHDAFFSKDRIKVVQTKAIKEYIEKCVLTFACGRSDDRTECYICEDDFLEIMNEMVGKDE